MQPATAEKRLTATLVKLRSCGLVGTLIVDEDAIFDPRSPNDRLLLGMNGTVT
jgi:hypothetical protein